METYFKISLILLFIDAILTFFDKLIGGKIHKWIDETIEKMKHKINKKSNESI